MDDFSKTILFKHVFDHGEPREILAFSKSEEDINLALKAGAEHAGGVEIIKQIQVRKFSCSFQYSKKYSQN